MYVQNEAIIYDLMPSLLSLTGATCAAVKALALKLFILSLLFIFSTSTCLVH